MESSEHFFQVGCGHHLATLHAAVAKSTFRSKNVAKLLSTFRRSDVASTFHRSDVAKLHAAVATSAATLHAAVAKSAFGSKNVKKLLSSEHFSKVGCRNIARRLWRKAHLEVKMSKNCVSEHFSKVGCRNIYAAVARNTFGSENVENVKKLWSSKHFSQLGCRKHFSQVGSRKIALW